MKQQQIGLLSSLTEERSLSLLPASSNYLKCSSGWHREVMHDQRSISSCRLQVQLELLYLFLLCIFSLLRSRCCFPDSCTCKLTLIHYSINPKCERRNLAKKKLFVKFLQCQPWAFISCHSHFLPCLVSLAHTNTSPVHTVHSSAHKHKQTLYIWLPAYSPSLSRIKVLPSLCEHNITLLYLFISSPVLNLLIKNCARGALKGFSSYRQ